MLKKSLNTLIIIFFSCFLIMFLLLMNTVNASVENLFNLTLLNSNYYSSSYDYNLVDEDYWNELGPENCSSFDQYYTATQTVASYIGYFDDVKNSDLITNSNYKGSNNCGVSNSLKSYISNYIPSFGESNFVIGDEPNHPSCGFQNYLEDYEKENLTCNLNWITITTVTQAAEVIDSGKPFIIYAVRTIGSTNHFAAGICFGYFFKTDNSEKKFLIHPLAGDMSQGDDIYTALLDSTYFFKGYYITNRFSSLDHHVQYTPIVGSPSSGHVKYCDICDHYLYIEGHNYMQIGLTRYRCLQCGYTTTNTGNDPIISSFEVGN